MYSFVLKSFNELSLEELYEVLELRQNIFILEQTCLYPDIDGLDKQCFHILLKDEKLGKIMAYARIVPPGLLFNEPAMGRVACLNDYRKHGIGKALVKFALDFCFANYPKKNIHIAAQTYLIKWYQNLGFKPVSVPYDEDGIEHINMLYCND